MLKTPGELNEHNSMESSLTIFGSEKTRGARKEHSGSEGSPGFYIQLAVSATQAGRNPLRSAFFTERMFAQAAA